MDITANNVVFHAPGILVAGFPNLPETVLWERHLKAQTGRMAFTSKPGGQTGLKEATPIESCLLLDSDIFLKASYWGFEMVIA